MADKLNFFLTAAIIAVILCVPAFAQYETLAGITADSPEYNEYKMCVDSCGQCETSCKSNIYRRTAEIQGNEEMCKQLPEAEQQMCLNRAYSMKASSSKNSADCQKISEEIEKKSCIFNVQIEKAIAGENEAECNSAPETMISMCKQSFYQRMAMQKQDASYCAKITDVTSKQICTDTIAMQKGIGTPPTPETAGTPASLTPSKNKSLIIYGIIILGVIILAVIAIVIIKKVRGKKPTQAPPLVVQQQKFPPLVMQQQPQQNMPQTAQPGEKR